MASYNFTTSGYIQLFFNGVLVSRHTKETEAIESLVNHSNTKNVSGTYTIERPTTKVVFKASETTSPQSGEISSNAFFDLDGLGSR